MERVFKKLVWAILVIPGIYLAFSWKQLPEMVGVHFNWKGEADRFGTKDELGTTVLALTLVTLFVYLVLINVYRIDPKKYAAANKQRLVRLGFGLVVFLSALQCMIIYSALKGDFSLGLMLPVLGLLFAFIGNYMPNIKPNYFAGFRLPWTLESEDNWKKTHALVGKLWFYGGLIIAVVCMVLPPKPGFIFFAATMIVITIYPIIYSYRYYLEQKRTTTNNNS